ncbi:MAG: PEGA domain-containing protein [Gemmatimonadota bacterium]
MRFTSSARRRIAAVLCVLLPGAASCPPALAEESRSPALLLAFHAGDIPAEVARARTEVISRRLLAELRIAWRPVPAQAGPSGTRREPPEADGASIERISSLLRDAARRMERMETREAETLLDAAEREARSFRPSESLRPYLAEIFLRRGVLFVWAGDRGSAEAMFGRVRALRPDFAPDPALYSPSVREAWARAAKRPPAGAEILVQSIPPGADIVVDGTPAGTTPARVRVPVLSPAAVRVTRPGYLPLELSGHWLPGDSEMFDVTLTRDRLSRLEELVAASGGGTEAGALLNGMAAAAGAERVAILVMTGSGPGARIRVLSLKRGDEEALAAGEFGWPEDGEDAEPAASAATMLRKAGWPDAGEARRAAPWYHKWWFWAALGAAIAGAAAGAGGGGGGSGGSTGAIGVNF